jgi:hypothetical protein
MSTNQNTSLYVGGQQSTTSATFDLAQNISAGQVPKNDQIVQSLKDLELPLSMQSDTKSGVEGRLAFGTSRLVRHTREMLEEKNSEDFLRNIHAHIVEAGEFLARSVNPTEIQAQGEAWATQQVNQLQNLVDAFRRLCLTLAKKPEFRVKVIEAIQLVQETAARFTEEALNKAEEKVEEINAKGFSQSTAEILQGIQSQGIEGIQSQETTEEKSAAKAEKKKATKKIREVLVELGKTPEYKETIETLFTFFDTNWAYLSTVLTNEVERASLTSLIVLSSDVQGLVEKFSGDESLTPLTSRIAQVLYSIPNDQDFINYFKDLKSVLRSSIESPESQNGQELEDKFKSLSETAKKLFKKKKLQEDLVFIFKEIKSLVDRVREDESLKKIGEDVERIRKEVLLNSAGEMDLVTLRNAVPALKNVLIPALTSAFASIPIPPIFITNEKYDINLTNISLAASDLVPEKIRIHFTNDILFDFSPESNDLFISSLYVGIKDFSAFVRDVNFKYDRKKTPQISDVGIADVEIVGTNIEIRWRMDFIGQRLLFYIDDVRCIVRQLNTTVKESGHMMINKIAASFFNSYLKRNIELTVESLLREKLLQFSVDTSAPLADQLPLSL